MATTRKKAVRKSSSGKNTERAIRTAAVSMFSSQGYHAATLRKLAEEIGIKAGSLYNHIHNKQDLLYSLLNGIMQDLLQGFESKVEGVDDPKRRLEIFIDNHVEFHTSRSEEVFIGNMELRNLESENHRALVKLRDRYQRKLTEILADGERTGQFAIDDMKTTVFAIFGMLNGISVWFNPRGPQSSSQISKRFQKLIWLIVAAKRSGKS